ncbi:MAG: Bax inhibitor-1/YccA family protein [Rhodospirillales bacterium]|nr:Bax inhibitor-1/YccA family protein [Rhodospirillales bacterium]
MAFGTDRNTPEQYVPGAVRAEAAVYDLGLRAYMLRVYNFMASGLALTGIVALVVVSNESLLRLFFEVGPRGGISPSILGWVAMIAPIGLVWAMSARIESMRASTAQALFWGYAGLMGISMCTIFVAYTGTSIARVFFITAGTFAAMSLYGYTTKRDLTGWGSFLFMGLIGILIASVVNIFLASSMMHFIISVAGVLVFVGLTAYDTQKIKEMYNERDDSEVASKKAIMGALELYMDFINLFIMLMRLFGDRR